MLTAGGAHIWVDPDTEWGMPGLSWSFQAETLVCGTVLSASKVGKRPHTCLTCPKMKLPNATGMFLNSVKLTIGLAVTHRKS